MNKHILFISQINYCRLSFIQNRNNWKTWKGEYPSPLIPSLKRTARNSWNRSLYEYVKCTSLYLKRIWRISKDLFVWSLCVLRHFKPLCEFNFFLYFSQNIISIQVCGAEKHYKFEQQLITTGALCGAIALFTLLIYFIRLLTSCLLID